MKRLIILLMLSLNCSTTAYAQDAKIRVFIEATANDTVGQQLVYELRETLNRSAHLTEAQSGDLSLFQIKIVTLDPSADGSSLQSSTVYSMVLTGSMLNGSKGKIFMDHWVGICGGNMAAKCATQLIASADSDMTPAAQAIKEILRKKSQLDEVPSEGLASLENDMAHHNFWDVHGIGFVLAMCFFPRLTLLFSSVATGGFFWWLGWLITPRLLVAILASSAYWHTNPILVVITWIWACIGEGAEKGAATGSKR